MYRISFLLLCLQLFCLEKPFCIIIPSFNNANWLEQNLDSVFDQNYENYRVIYIADAPTDGTAELVREYVKKREQEHRFTLLVNPEKEGFLACMCQAAYLCDREEIIVELDGNDWLAHNDVLSFLNLIYSDPDVWMTYGQFSRYPDFSKGFAWQVPEDTIEKNTFRSLGGYVTHLKSFYACLFHEIQKKDFLHDGKIIRKAGDLAYILPILEMSGKHARFIPEILYVFNYSFPLHEHKTSEPEVQIMDDLIRQKAPYSPLSFLPNENVHPIYSQIKDIYHPSLHDYRFIQDFLSYGQRDKLELLGDFYHRGKNVKLIGKTPAEYPRSGKITINTDELDRENCIILYTSFNERYPQGLERLIKLIENSDYSGHLLYRFGGWPDTEGGSLVLSHIPYAFKAPFFKEAERLGYKRVLWLDASIIPIISLNSIFDKIAEDGIFIMDNGLNIGPYTNPEALIFFGLNQEQADQIPSCSAGLFGVDFTNPLGKRAIDWWYRACFDQDAYFSTRPEQNALSAILYRLGFQNLTSIHYLPHSPQEVKDDSLFRLDREFVH